MRLPPAALALLLAAPLPAAALEKCIDADGKTSYVDRCPAGSMRAPSKTDEQLIPKVPPAPVITKPNLPPLEKVMKPVPPPAPPAPPASASAGPLPTLQAPPADVKMEYYDVEGTDQPSLVAALNAHGTGHARSSWKLGYQYQPRREKAGCVVGTVSTQLDLAMTLPRWAPPAGTAPELVERWQKYVNALMAHENARLDQAREMENALKPALQGLPAAPDCDALDAAVRARYDALQQETRAREAERVERDKVVFQ